MEWRPGSKITKTSQTFFPTNLVNSGRVNKRKMVFLLRNTTQKTLQEIADDVGLSKSGVCLILQRWQGKKSLEDLPRSGRPKMLSKKSQKILETIVENDPSASSQSILLSLESKILLKNLPTERTIRNYRKNVGFEKKNTRIKAILRPTNKIKRFNYATKFKNYLWRNHIFIYETDVELYHVSRSAYYKKNQDPIIHAPRKSPKIKLICGISRKGPIFLRCYDGNLNARKFVSMMVDLKRQIYSKYSKPTIVLDNARPHTAKYTTSHLQKHYDLLFVPPQSPELNPIEKVFGFFKKRVANSKPKTVKELNLFIKKNWKTISKKECNETILNLQKECQTVIYNKGDNHY